jgi:hypothetical protein
MRKVDVPTCHGHYKGLTLNSPGLTGDRMAVGIACFGASDQYIYAGGAACHPGKNLRDDDGKITGRQPADRWNRHIGRTVAALRMVRIPIGLAALLAIEQAPWDIKHPINGKKLHNMESLPWSLLTDCGAFPSQSLPAVVDAVRQALRHRLMETPKGTDAAFSFIVHPASLAIETPVELPDAYHENCQLASDLVDLACKLPMRIAPPPHLRSRDREPATA